MTQNARPQAGLVASVPLNEDHAIHVTIESRKGRPAATLRLYTRLFSPRANGRVMLATKRAFSVDLGSLTALAEAIKTARDVLIADSGGA